MEHKKCHISEMRVKKKKSDIGRSGSGKICAIVHVHYMHGGQRAFPPKKKEKLKWYLKAKIKKKSLPVLRCYTRSLFRMDRSFGGAVGHHNIDFDT